MKYLLVVFFLLMQVSSTSAFSLHSTSFPVEVNIIEDPSQPLVIGKTALYWDGYFRPDISKPMHCKVLLDSDKWTLGEYRFENGTKPKAAHFACQFGFHCAGMKCGPEDYTLPVSLFIIVAILLITCCICRYNRPRATDIEEYELTLNHVSDISNDDTSDIDTAIDENHEVGEALI